MAHNNIISINDHGNGCVYFEFSERSCGVAAMSFYGDEIYERVNLEIEKEELRSLYEKLREIFEEK